MLTTKQRARAIFHCFYFGVMPSWVYEKKCHYKPHGDGEGADTYWSHMALNLQIAKHLICKTEHPCTHKFHRSPVKYFRWQWKSKAK